MKREEVSAFRERGLRPGVCREAEPQVWSNRNSNSERKADTMKTCILRPFKTVDAQKASLKPSQKPGRKTVPHPPGVADQEAVVLDPDAALTAALTQDIIAAADKRPALCIGLDVHNDSIAVSLAPEGSTEVRRYGVIGGSHDEVLKLARKLQAAHLQARLKFCYEAGPRGYPLCRFLQSHCYHCIIVSPSKVPRQPGNRVKTDRRDADQLARLYLGLVPSEDTTGDERMQGGITKMGNGFARRALIEAAWHYRQPVRITPHFQKRQKGLPKVLTDASWTAQTRLHARFKRCEHHEWTHASQH